MCPLLVADLEDIGAAADAPVHEQGHSVAYGRPHGRHHVQGGRAVVQLAAPVVRQHNAIYPGIHSRPCILWTQHTLQSMALT